MHDQNRRFFRPGAAAAVAFSSSLLRAAACSAVSGSFGCSSFVLAWSLLGLLLSFESLVAASLLLVEVAALDGEGEVDVLLSLLRLGCLLPLGWAERSPSSSEAVSVSESSLLLVALFLRILGFEAESGVGDEELAGPFFLRRPSLPRR